MRIQTRTVIFLVVLLLITISVSGYFFLNTGKTAIEEINRNLLKSVVILKENQLNNFIIETNSEIDEILNEEKTILYFNEFINSGEKETEIINIFNKKIEHSPFTELFLMDLEGLIVASTDSNQIGKIKNNEKYFVNGKKEKNLQGFYFDTSLQKPSMTISAPIKIDQEFIGVLVARIDLSKISEIMIERAGLGETGETYLVNSYNYLVSKSRFIENIEYKKTIHSDVITDCLNGNSGHSNYIDYRGKMVKGSYRWIDELDVCLIAEIDENEIYATIRVFEFTIIIFVIILSIIASIAALIFSKIITVPISKLRDAAIKIGMGEMNTKISVDSRDEVGDLAKAFKKMVKEIKSSRKELHKKNIELENTVNKRTRELQSKIFELESFSRLSVGRELKMVELKKKIRDLERGGAENK